MITHECGRCYFNGHADFPYRFTVSYPEGHTWEHGACCYDEACDCQKTFGGVAEVSELKLDNSE